MNLNALWMELFGTDTFMNLDIGFWVSMFVVLLIVVAMNVVFWNMKPEQSSK